MPRTASPSAGGIAQNALNRGNARGLVFHDAGDFAAFVNMGVPRSSILRRLARPDSQRWLSDGPAPRPTGWLDWVNQAQTQKELDPLRKGLARGAPYGQEDWAKQTAARLGLESTINPRGRPRKEKKK